MYGTAATMIGYLSVAPAFQEGLYTPERHLFYVAIETFIYEYRKSIGMLSAYAEPFYPPMEENKQKEDVIKEDKVQNKDTENTTNTTNDKTIKDKTPISNKEKKSTQEESNVIEEDWVQVKCNAKTKVVREALQEAYIKNVHNHYAVLKVTEEVVDEKNEIKEKSVVKKEAIEHCITNNVNDITFDEMIQHINEYKKNDVNAKVPEGKRNEKLNSIALYKTSSTLSVETKEETVQNIPEENDSENEEDTEDDDSITDEDKLMIDNVDSEDSSTIGSTDKESKDDTNGGEKKSEQIERIRYQNDVLLFRLEQAEETEKRIKKELQVSKEEALKEERKYVEKITALESALKKKTKLLLNELRKKGRVIQCAK